MRVSFSNPQPTFNRSITFNGQQQDDFWRSYNKTKRNIPLSDTVSSSINNNSLLIGEGRNKKVYAIEGVKEYVIRIFKKYFNQTDLKNEFTEPENSHINTIDEVALCIPDKIDIVKRKDGIGIGVENYFERIQANEFPPMQRVYVTRQETLKSLDTYEKLKDFPLKAYEEAYLKIKDISKKPGWQLDVICPNNILVDTKAQKINIIDPLGPENNDLVQGKNMDLSTYHGCDSLYPVMCDVVLHKEHLNNLTEKEKLKWKKAVSIIISKCITAGQNIGYKRNIAQLGTIYAKMDKFWQTNEISERYNHFLETYSGTINKEQTIERALNYKLTEKERINAIRNLDISNFNEMLPVFEKILEAPHQAKVEMPEILNAVFDKLPEYNENIAAIIPSLEVLFKKEIFYPTKKRLYNFFITNEPENKIFLKELSKSSVNPMEKSLYRDEFKKLYDNSDNLPSKGIISNIYLNSISGNQLPKELIDKLWISRTCTNSGKKQAIAINNAIQAYNYIETIKDQKPSIKTLINLHRIVLKNVPEEAHIAGQLRTPGTNHILKQIFKIKKDFKNTINPYSNSETVISDLRKLKKYINDNYDKKDPFILATDIFKELIRIHPFLNGNGRASRLFTEHFLLSKGYKLTKWPEEFLYRNLYTTQQLAECLKNNSVNT